MNFTAWLTERAEYIHTKFHTNSTRVIQSKSSQTTWINVAKSIHFYEIWSAVIQTSYKAVLEILKELKQYMRFYYIEYMH